MRILSLGAALLAGMTSVAANATTLYSNNFDGATATYAGVSVTPFAGGAALQGMNSLGGFSGNAVVNKTTGNPAGLSELILSNLPTHTSIDVNFLLGFVNSWDGNVNNYPLGDYLDILIDGNVVATMSVYNYNYDATAPVLAGGTEITHGALDNVGGYGFDNDRIVDMGTAGALSFAHTGSSLTIGIRAYGVGWQGTDDEYWAIDNLSVTAGGLANGVPEPATWAMMIGGLAVVGTASRRRVKAKIALS